MPAGLLRLKTEDQQKTSSKDQQLKPLLHKGLDSNIVYCWPAGLTYAYFSLRIFWYVQFIERVESKTSRPAGPAGTPQTFAGQGFRPAGLPAGLLLAFVLSARRPAGKQQRKSPHLGGFEQLKHETLNPVRPFNANGFGCIKIQNSLFIHGPLNLPPLLNSGDK